MKMKIMFVILTGMTVTAANAGGLLSLGLGAGTNASIAAGAQGGSTNVSMPMQVSAMSSLPFVNGLSAMAASDISANGSLPALPGLGGLPANTAATAVSSIAGNLDVGGQSGVSNANAVADDAATQSSGVAQQGSTINGTMQGLSASLSNNAAAAGSANLSSTAEQMTAKGQVQSAFNSTLGGLNGQVDAGGAATSQGAFSIAGASPVNADTATSGAAAGSGAMNDANGLTASMQGAAAQETSMSIGNSSN